MHGVVSKASHLVRRSQSCGPTSAQRFHVPTSTQAFRMHRPPHSSIASLVPNKNANDRDGNALACLLHDSQKKWCEVHFASCPLHINADGSCV